jgi:hypothetical protein
VLPVRLASSNTSETLPMLVEADTWLPLRMPLRWVVRTRRWECMPSTLADNLRSIALLYDWADQVLEVDLDDLISQGGLLTSRQIDSLVAHLRTRVSHAELARLGVDQVPSLATLAKVARPVRNFLRWAADPQVRGGTGRLEAGELALYRSRLDQLFRSAVCQPAGSERVRPLGRDEDNRVRDLIGPLRGSRGVVQVPFQFHPDNPFALHTRLRNWLMYLIARELGFRRSEILALWISDVISSPVPLLRVRRRPNDATDTRRYRAEVKRGERELPISDELRAGLRAYQTLKRPGGRLGARSPLLFVVASSGMPLSLRCADKLVKVIGRATDIADLSWGTFRHTWAEEAAEELLGEHRGEEERTLAVLRQLGGWSATSQTPAHYIQNALRREAWAYQERRAKRLWKTAVGGTDQPA